MPRRCATRPRDGGSDGKVPDGWYRIAPEAQVTSSRNNNAHPVTPPSASTSSQCGAKGPDSLGLVKAVNPMRLLLRETRAKDKMMATIARASSTTVPPGPGVASPSNRESHAARSSPRHLKLVQRQTNPPSSTVSDQAKSSFAVAEAFSPQRSLRLASLSRRRSSAEAKKPPDTSNPASGSPIRDPVSQPADHSIDLPLHELIQRVDDAVDADPFVDSNQAAVTHLFMAQWLAKFDSNRPKFKSIAVHAEVGFQELYRLTTNLPSPNELLTSFTCRVLSDLAPHFGPYAPLIRVLHTELHLSAYSSDQPSLPYFAIVKNQKRLVLALRKDKKRRRERNAFLAHEIRQVHDMFRHFLDACSYGLVRTLFREWYSIAVIRKKNSKKYIEYFSAWFTGSAKSLVPKLFATWKHETLARKMHKMQAQLSVDGEKLAALQRQVDELSVQRDVAQVESLAIRNDRKQAEDMIQRLNRKIQSASAYLEGSYRREGIVCQEGQLRVEAASFLPPLILESLLRGYHSVGFLQQLHNEFIPKPQESANDSKAGAAGLQRKPSAVIGEGGTALARRQSSAVSAEPVGSQRPPANHTVLQDCLAEIIRLRGLPPASGSISQQQSGEVSIQDFARLFQSIQQRMDAKNVNVLFTRAPPATAMTGSLQSVNAEAIAEERGANNDSDDEADDEEDKPAKLRQLAEQIASLYEQVLLAIRAQDEHYARNMKLFSSRMLESHEVSVVPHTNHLSAFNRPSIALPSIASTDTESEKNSSELHGLPSPISALRDDSLSMASQPQSGDLGVINGSKRFSIANVCPIEMTPLQFDKQPAKNSSSVSSMPPSLASNGALEQLAFVRWSDFSLSNRHTRAFVMLFLAHLASEFGSLLFSPTDMSAFVHNAYAHTPSPSPPGTNATGTTKTIENDQQQGFQNLVTAYEVWNRLAAQMIEAEIAQSRGGTLALALAAEASTAPGSTDGSGGGIEFVRRGSTLLAGSGGVLAIRPKLLLHIEPLPQGVLMTSAKEKESSSNTTNHGGTRLSLALGETFHTARIRRLSLEDAQTLTQCVTNIHRVVAQTSTRLQDFNVVRQQLKDFRQLQWEQASELASQFASQSIAPATTAAAAPVQVTSVVFTSSHLVDERKHVFECISFDNPVLERIFSIEENPHEELERVRGTLERKKHLVRHLYTKHRAHIQHAVSLDDLWHFVKVLRFPKEIHMLPAMRDEDMAANGFEQLFTPDDLAEILLQLCNEQFAPQIVPLSARVEYFARHHLPFAAQNQSIIRELMHEPDVKRALADHSQTIRIIFRRYCAKERELSGGSTAATMHQHQQLHGGSSATGAKANVHTQQQGHRAPARHTSHGITKYMRLVDWLAFIQDYNLLRPRFPIDSAVVVFRNVQEAVAPPNNGSETQEEQQLEMIYSEFCEALVGVASCFFPDPFLKSATKVSQFIQRFLPVSPEEVCSHV